VLNTQTPRIEDKYYKRGQKGKNDPGHSLIRGELPRTAKGLAKQRNKITAAGKGSTKTNKDKAQAGIGQIRTEARTALIKTTRGTTKNHSNQLKKGGEDQKFDCPWRRDIGVDA